MINIKVFFGHELKIRVKQKVMEETIGEWAHTFYLSYLPDIDLDFRELLLTISTMELGSEFYFTLPVRPSTIPAKDSE